jgi:pimeloyl-ACP methyl ester carboxylesterase
VIALTKVSMRCGRALVAASLCSAVAGAQTTDLSAAPGRLVDIGGRKLHLLCSGHGVPTVVLEAGASAFAIDWTLVQRSVAGTTRVCAYDRAGMGWSDASSDNADLTAAADLHMLLSAAGERPPFVLVGASRGGLFVRAYRADHPDQVVGLVFVDPATEDRLFTMVGGRSVLIASTTAEQVRATVPSRTVAVPRRRAQTGAPFDRLPEDLYRTRVLLDERLIASYPDSVTPEFIAVFSEGQRSLLARLLSLRSASATPLGDLPTVVLTRGNENNAELEAAHAGLARLSNNSRHTVVAGAGHEIHLFEPRVVAEAILDVIEAARAKTPLRRR